MNCQACGAYNPGGSAACLKCGVLLIAAVDPGGARCRLHPETPATGTCSRCGSFGCGVCLTPKGDAWFCSDCEARAAVLPWDERETIGVWRAWWRTSVMMISAPGATLSGAKAEGSLGGSVLFTLLSTLAGYGTTIVLYVVAFVPMMLFGLSKSENAPALSGVFVGVGAVVYVVLLLAMQTAGVLVLGGLDHLMLRLLGASPKGYKVSVRANALALGPSLVGLVPFCGLYVFPIWCLVLRIIALRHFHQTTAGKAALAVLVPIVLLCGVCGAGYLGLFALGMSQGFR
ncbi:MAG: Yip1 family protein [Myxococcota bacterium]